MDASRRVVLALAAGLLAACAGAPALRGGNGFGLSGSINVRVEQKAYPGRIRWSHHPQGDEVWISTPVGTSVAYLRRDAGGAVLVDAQGQRHEASDAGALSREVLGWELPLDGLPYWVRGRPWPDGGAPRLERDALGRLRTLQQAEWQVDYLDWSGAPGTWLPSRLELSRGDLRVRMAIQAWAS